VQFTLWFKAFFFLSTLRTQREIISLFHIFRKMLISLPRDILFNSTMYLSKSDNVEKLDLCVNV